MLTFDWAQISYIGNPLVVPWWAEANVFVGFFITFWVFCPIMYYTNVRLLPLPKLRRALTRHSATRQTWSAAYLPMSSSDVFDRFGHIYDANRIVDVATNALNSTAYHEYSPLYLPITYAAFYAVAFASSTALITHTAIYHGKEMYDRIRNLRTEEEDIHYKLMKQYPEVPEVRPPVPLALSISSSLSLRAVVVPHLPRPFRWNLDRRRGGAARPRLELEAASSSTFRSALGHPDPGVGRRRRTRSRTHLRSSGRLHLCDDQSGGVFFVPSRLLHTLLTLRAPPDYAEPDHRPHGRVHAPWPPDW